MTNSNGNGNGWTGRDPRLRLLRSAAVVVLLALLAFVIVDGQPNDVYTLGTLAGALLVALGFEAGVRWPTDKGDKHE